MDNKIRKIYDIINKLILQYNAQYNIKYLYTTIKTLIITIYNLNNKDKNIIIRSKDIFEYNLSKIFAIDFDINKGNYVKYDKDIIIIATDIIPIDYKMFNDSIKLVKSTGVIYSKCILYFCEYNPYKSEYCYGNKNFTYTELYIELFNRIRSIDISRIKGINSTIACRYVNNTLPSSNWINLQIKYLNNLDSFDKKVIRLYTNIGDKLMNSYIRNKMLMNNQIFQYMKTYYNSHFKETYQEKLKSQPLTFNSVERYIKILIYQLQKIILNSPQIDKSFYVYRGRKDKLITINDRIYQTDSFTSASAFTTVAIKFSKNKGYGTIYRFRIRNKCLLMSNSKYPSEFEILLPYFDDFTIKSMNKNVEFVNPIFLDKITADYVEVN